MYPSSSQQDCVLNIHGSQKQGAFGQIKQIPGISPPGLQGQVSGEDHHPTWEPRAWGFIMAPGPEFGFQRILSLPRWTAPFLAGSSSFLRLFPRQDMAGTRCLLVLRRAGRSRKSTGSLTSVPESMAARAFGSVARKEVLSFQVHRPSRSLGSRIWAPETSISGTAA